MQTADDDWMSYYFVNTIFSPLHNVALILEEMAIDENHGQRMRELLDEAQTNHVASLSMCEKVSSNC